MVKDVEELGPELHGEPLVNREGLESRQRELPKWRPVSSGWAPTQDLPAGQWEASRGGGAPQGARLLECVRISKPAQLAVRIGMQSELLALAGHVNIVAVRARGCRGG